MVFLWPSHFKLHYSKQTIFRWYLFILNKDIFFFTKKKFGMSSNKIGTCSPINLLVRSGRFRDIFPNANHVIRSNSDDKVTVVRYGQFVNNDIMPVQGNLPGILQMIILELGPHQAGRGSNFGFILSDGWFLCELGHIIYPNWAFVISASNQAISYE